MQASSVLGVVRAQRHDFLNHLQVILGYLQLNKVSEAREYIAEVVGIIAEESKITRLHLPEVALVFLVAQNEAAQKGITIKYDLQTDLDKCALSGEEISSYLEWALAQAIFSLSPLSIRHREIKVNLREEPGYYVCVISFFCRDPYFIKEQLEAVRDRFSSGQGQAKFEASNGTGAITLCFSVR